MNGVLAANQAAGMGSIFIMYAVVIGVFWFFLMRPQKKEQKRVQAMLSTMEIGDTVLTTSGFYGVIIDISDEAVIVEFGSNKNCRIPMQRAAISVVEKPEDASKAVESKKGKDASKAVESKKSK